MVVAVAFSIFDLDHNGYIERQEMVRITEVCTLRCLALVCCAMLCTHRLSASHTCVQGFGRILGPLVTFSGKKHQNPNALVEELFDTMDTNSDGRISFEEYKQGALKNPEIIQGLQLFS